MKNSFVSTFSKSKENEIRKYFSEHSSAIEPELFTSNIVVYKTTLRPEQLAETPDLNSIFILIKKFDDLTGSYFKPMFQWSERHTFEMVGQISKSFGFKSFRAIISDNDRIISSHRNAIKALERKISKETGLKVNRVNPDTEVWVVHTKDRYGFIMCKISSPKKLEEKQD